MMLRNLAWFAAAASLCVASTVSAAPLHQPSSHDPQTRTGPATGQKPPHDGREGSRDQGRRRKWWQNEKDRDDLGLTAQQSADIEQIFQATIPKLRAMNEELQQLEATLTQTIAAGTADAATVERQAQSLEMMRAKLSATRTVMLYRMHQVLSAEQRGKLKAMFDREADRRGSGSPDKREDPRRH